MKENQNKQNSSGFFGRTGRMGIYTGAVTLVVLAVLIFVNLIVSALPSSVTKTDTTANSIYTISPETEAFLGRLDTDVTLYYVCQSGTENTHISAFVERYAAVSDRIKTVTVDPLREPDFLAKMAILTPTGDTWHAAPAEGTEGYSYGDREGDTSAFHIVTDTGGNMFCIGKDDSYENGHKVQWVLLFNGREKYTEPYFDNADAVQQGAFAPFLSIAPEEGIYSVYITDTVSGVSERISNILEFRVKK